MRVQKASNRILDRIDLHILSILQQDARIVIKDLAEQVGLSLTPCIERVKRMERDGVIQGYYARINPQALGMQILVFVEITLHQKSEKAFDRFRRGAAGAQRGELQSFYDRERGWLDDYALFMAVKDAHGGRPWPDWPADIRRRAPDAIDAT